MKKYSVDWIEKTGTLKKSTLRTSLFPMTALLIGIFIFAGCYSEVNAQGNKTNIKVGAYYFDGWAGKNKLADNPNEPWAKNAPTHLTKRFACHFRNWRRCNYGRTNSCHAGSSQKGRF